MASFAAPSSFCTTKRVPNSPFFSNKKTIQYRFKVSCRKDDDDNEKLFKTSLDHVDRRNVLLGLGGLYSTLNLHTAFADPITTPSITTCKDAETDFDVKHALRSNACCPGSKYIHKRETKFMFPKADEVIRVRPAAHRLTPDYVAKYRAAIQAMRDLPDDHPHSFVQQAKIHCAYCSGGYHEILSDGSEIELQIHNSWLFFPFHRWYLYFYERILGKLIGDPTFALPYWNWDNPLGMTMPEFFEQKCSTATRDRPDPLFDQYRHPNHYPPAIIDIDYSDFDSGTPCAKQISTNLTLMYKQMIRNAPDSISFFGGKYCASKNNSDREGKRFMGTIEAGCHNAVHRWMGDPRNINNEDMGNFYSAGYDPLFYMHHANVDRMWQIWKDLGIKGHSEPTHPDWLDASFLFFDENVELVRVYNRDCVQTEKLKYKYEKSPLIWLKSRPFLHGTPSKLVAKSIASVKKVEDDVAFPLKLKEIVKVLVKRPDKSRSKEDKEKASELLLIKGVVYNSQKFVKFNVFVNDHEGDVSAINAFESEFAGSFVQVPHKQKNKNIVYMTSGIRLGLTELLEDKNAEDDEYVLVTLVPITGCDDASISDIKVELVPIV